MTKRFIAILRYTLAVAMVASAFTFSGCKDDDNGPTTFDGTIMDYIKQDKFKQATSGDADTAFDSLVLYLDKYPDLELLLTGSADYTLFAPSNKAFVSLTALPGLKDPDQINPDIIKGVLAYHFVAGKTLQSDMTAGAEFTTIYVDPTAQAAQKIKINGDGTLLTGSSNTSIQVTTFDQLTKNGVVHTTATVLIPPTTGGQLSAILGSLGATVLLGKDFTFMAYMIGLADFGVTDPTKTFTGVIAKGSNLTLLAIPNAVFMAATGKTNATEVKAAMAVMFTTGADGTARATLNNHVLLTKYVVTAAEGSTTFTTGQINAMSTKVLSVTTGVPVATCQCPTGVVIGAAKTGGGESHAPIVKADISTTAGISNGILQVVGGIILP